MMNRFDPISLVILTLAVSVVVGCTPIRTPPALSAAATTQPDFRALDRYVEERLAATDLPGLALAVTHDNEVLYLKGYGSAGRNEPVTPQTQFHIASVSKSFTALAVMQLVEAGAIDLDAPVQSYLPEFQSAAAEHTGHITVRHLLNQTSGFDFSGFPKLPPEQQPTSLEALVNLMRQAEPISAPGMEFHYFDPNYGVLARLVEVVSGEPFNAYLQRHIFAPLQMDNTLHVITAAEASAAAPQLAQGYRLETGIPTPQQEAGYVGGSGGVISTAADMANYLIMQNNGGQFGDIILVSPNHITLMHTPPVDIASPYAMGWAIIDPAAKPRVLEHWGDLASFHADALLLPDERYGIVLLYNANLNGDLFHEIKTGIVRFIVD